MEPNTFTGYVTKFALSIGVIEVTLKETGTPRMVEHVGLAYLTYYHGNDWWRTRDEAVRRAEVMRDAKLLSLRGSIARLEALNFGIAP